MKMYFDQAPPLSEMVIILATETMTVEVMVETETPEEDQIQLHLLQGNKVNYWLPL